jgi:hypothetical protein
VATRLWLGGGSNLGAFGLSATGGRAWVGEDARGHVGLSAVMQTAPKFGPPLHRRREWGQNVFITIADFSKEQSRKSTTARAFGSSNEVHVRVVIVMLEIRRDLIIHTTNGMKLEFGILKLNIWLATFHRAEIHEKFFAVTKNKQNRPTPFGIRSYAFNKALTFLEILPCTWR